MTYRVTLTVSICRSRMARAMAWFSTLGFHCGSMMNMRFAAVRLRLEISQQGKTSLRGVNFGCIPKSTRTRCHEKHTHVLVVGKTVDDALPLGHGDLAVHAYRDYLCQTKLLLDEV